LPIYEYECKSCGNIFEVLQKFSDAPISECTKCKGPVRKLLGTPALQFKGSGWYITDYAGKSPMPGNAQREGAKADKGSSEPSGTKSETKPGNSACSCTGSCGH
jgi:putative FmdB family regulatory protein